MAPAHAVHPRAAAVRLSVAAPVLRVAAVVAQDLALLPHLGDERHLHASLRLHGLSPVDPFDHAAPVALLFALLIGLTGTGDALARLHPPLVLGLPGFKLLSPALQVLGDKLGLLQAPLATRGCLVFAFYVCNYILIIFEGGREGDLLGDCLPFLLAFLDVSLPLGQALAQFFVQGSRCSFR